MVRKLSKLLLMTSLACVFGTSNIGCTVAVPDVSALAQLSTFSAKSASPFNQENPGSMLFLSGQCLPTVSTFEFRMNNHAIWSLVSATEPTPDSSSGEYKVGNPNYDVDCSDGSFDFFMYVSTAMNNFDLNGTSPAAGDPALIEIRGLDSSGNPISPTIIFKRPSPSSFRIEPMNYNGAYNMVEVGRTMLFKIKLIDANGKHTTVPSGEIVSMVTTLTDLSAAMSPAGTIYESTCTTPATAADLTFNPGDDEMTICFNSTGASASHVVQIDLSASGMLGNFFQVPIQSANSALSFLRASGPNSSLPQTLLRGGTYNLAMGLTPLYSNFNTRNINTYDGDLTINAFNSNISFTNSTSDPDCEADKTTDYTCSTTSNPNKYFAMTIGAGYPYSYLDLSLSATPTPGCSTCQIYESPSFYPITSYLPISMRFGVVDGSAAFSFPYFRSQESLLRTNQCSSFDIAQANSDGTIIPALGKSMTVSTSDSSITFYYDNNCSILLGPSTVVTFAVGDLIKRVYYLVPSVPADGIANVNITDGGSNWTYDFYVKPNDP